MAYSTPEKELLYKARVRAAKRGLPFVLEATDIVIPEFCPILNIPLIPGHKTSWLFSPTVDRVDNSKGYYPSNVWVISSLANQMKSNASVYDLILFAQWVRQKYGTSLQDGLDAI